MITCNHPKHRSSKRCRACMWLDPEFRARHAAAGRASLAKTREQPGYLEKHLARATALLAKINADGRSVTPEVIAKRSATYSARRLGWCPSHLRDEYRRLVRSQHLKAAEAREIILRQWDAELARRAKAA